MTINVEQHKAFEEGFHAMETHFQEVQKNPSVYDGEKVARMIEHFGQVFVMHMREEIMTLDPTRMRNIFPVEQELKDAIKEMIDWVIARVDKLNGLPFVC
jgi:hypothetical protein